MDPWLEQQPSWRINPNPTTNVFDKKFYGTSAKVDENNNMSFPPTLNKHATFLSGFADQIVRLKEAYEGKSRKTMTVEKQLELILPIVFFPSADIFRRVTDEWICTPGFMEKEAQTKNLTLVYIADAKRMFGKINKGGKFPRHQPTFNGEPDERWVTLSLIILREAVIASCKRKCGCSYSTLKEQVSEIPHAGPLLTQHLIHSMALTGLIDPIYGAKAEICDGTMASKRLFELHSIPNSTNPCLLDYVGNKYSWLPYLAENAICKSGQKKKCQFKDVIYGSQEYLYWIVQDKDGTYRVAYLKREWSKHDSGPGIRHKLLPKFKKDHLTFSESLESTVADCTQGVWWSPKFKTDVPEDIKIKKGDHLLGKRRVDNGDTSVSRKKQKRQPRTYSTDKIVPSPPPVPFRTDWTKIDRQEAKRILADYERAIKQNVLYHSKKTSARQTDMFGDTNSNRDFALRTVHSVGTHFTAPTRKVCNKNGDHTTRHSIAGSTKIPCHLLSMGIELVQWNIHRMAEKLLVASYKSRFAERQSKDSPSGHLVLKYTTIPVRSRVLGKPMGRRFFVPRVELHCIEKNTKATSVLMRVFIKRGAVGKIAMPILHEGLVRGEFYSSDDLAVNALFTTAYVTTDQAVRSILWYVIRTYTRSVESWLMDYCDAKLWRSPKSDNVSTDHSLNRSDVPTDAMGTVRDDKSNTFQYMCISLHNGKGAAFATLIRHVNNCIWMRFESETRRNESGAFLNASIFKLCETDAFMNVANSVDKLSKAPVRVIRSDHERSVNDHEQSVKIHATLAIHDNKQREKESRTVERTPVVVDPIDLNNVTEFSTMNDDLERWNGVWGSQIDFWKSKAVRRQNSAHIDRYWQPTGFHLSFQGIRSKADLRLFLDHCTQQEEDRRRDNPPSKERSSAVDYFGAIETFVGSKRK